MAFEYMHRFSVDEEIISRYDYGSLCGVKFIFETRTNVIVKGRFDDNDGVVERIIDCEIYEVDASKHCDEEFLQECVGFRLKDYWMPRSQNSSLINQLLLFSRQIAAGGRRGQIPVALDVDVCTVQREGEAIDATVERAMRPEYLIPLYLCSVNDFANPKQQPKGYEANFDLI